MSYTSTEKYSLFVHGGFVMNTKTSRLSLFKTLLFASGFLLSVTGDVYAWHGGHGYGGWGHHGGWGHGYYHGGYHGGGWGYGGRGWGWGGGTQVLIGPGVGFGYYGGAPCKWVGGHRNLNGHWVGAHRVCW